MRTLHGLGCVLLMLAASCGGSDAARPPPSPPPPPPPGANTTPPPPPPSSPPNPDADAVESARPSFRACYDKARAANPALGRTTVTISVRVDETGKPSTVDLEYKHKFDEPSKTCMRDAAFAMKLPAGQPRRVEVPMTFEPRTP
ncbi:MAG: hypothetical protein ACLQVI_37630 [Polyangiaceae bacterium]